MKYFILIHARSTPGALSHLLSPLDIRGIFPDFFCSQRLSPDAVKVRLEITCHPRDLEGFQAHCQDTLRVEAFIAEPLNTLQTESTR